MRAPAIYSLAPLLLAIVIAGCSSTSPTEDPTPTLAPEAAPPDTEVPAATEPPPTETETSAADTPVPAEPIEIDPDQVADDGCPVAVLNTESWGPMHASYNAGSDPFFHFHDNENENENGFYFNVELYTAYGAGWTGQTGTFETDCDSNGICVYLVPDDVNPYLATVGEIAIDSLSQEGGTLLEPVQLTISNLTLQPVPGSSSTGCFHINEVSISIGD